MKHKYARKKKERKHQGASKFFQQKVIVQEF